LTLFYSPHKRSSHWVTNNKNITQSTEQQQQQQQQPKEGRRGPTTEAGREKFEARRKAKEEKEQRKQEKNRRKRKAYRERQRAKQWGSQPNASRKAWSKKEAPRSEKDPKKKPKEKKPKKGSKKKTSQVEEEQDNQQHQPPQSHQTRWEATLEKALRVKSFESMQRLFEDRLMWSFDQEASSTRRLIIQNYRELSTKYHPDRNTSEHADTYKIAFQALNEAKSVCQERYQAA